MGFLDNVRLAGAALFGRVKAASSWNWRTGTKPGQLFDGSKFKGSLIYPSSWDQDTQALRDRSRIAYWDSTQARALLGRLVDNVVGTGLFLEHSPVWALLKNGMSKKEQREMTREVELRFHLWAMSKEADASGRMNLYELQNFEFLNRLRDGETVIVLRYSGEADRMSPLNIQFLLPEQIQTPYDSDIVAAAKAAGTRIIDGIQIDSNGREIAVYVQEEIGGKATRVPVMGPSGRRFVLHPMVTETLGAVRGTPLLAPLVHELQKMTDYTVAEIEAAVINAVLAVWVKPSTDAPASNVLAGIRARGATPTDSKAKDQGETGQTKIDKPGLFVQNLKAGEEIVSFDTKRPNANFGEFVRVITRHLSASVGVPIEVLEESFNANYSASRASLILFWTTVEKWRNHTASQFLNPIFEAWFTEEVRSGRIKAPGYLSDAAILRRAWLNCSWLGASKPSIDPLKEANAVRVRIEDGATTREREALNYNGSDYGENVSRLKEENQELAEANQSIKKEKVQPPRDGAEQNSIEEEQRGDEEE